MLRGGDAVICCEAPCPWGWSHTREPESGDSPPTPSDFQPEQLDQSQARPHPASHPPTSPPHTSMASLGFPLQHGSARDLPPRHGHAHHQPPRPPHSDRHSGSIISNGHPHTVVTAPAGFPSGMCLALPGAESQVSCGQFQSPLRDCCALWVLPEAQRPGCREEKPLGLWSPWSRASEPQLIPGRNKTPSQVFREARKGEAQRGVHPGPGEAASMRPGGPRAHRVC